MLDWNHIDTALIDMDGVLLDLSFDSHFWVHHLPRQYARIHGVSFEAAQEKLHAMYKEREGTMDWYDVDYWSRRLLFDVGAVKARQAGRIRPLPQAVRFLTTLERRGVRRVLLTNAHPKSLRLKMAATRLHRHLDEVISTFELGHGKESHALWERLTKKLNLDPARTLLIEDSLTNLTAAAGYGIGHLVQITRPDSEAGLREAGNFPAVADVGELFK
ncbi:MAG: GMP/IMP nucleotidase [Leptospirillia bacterium]